MLPLMLPNVFSLLDKDFMLPFGSIRLLRLHTWNWVSIILCFLLYCQFFSLLDKEFMLPFGIIRLLRFHIWNCVKHIIMLLLMQAKWFLLLDKDFMFLFGSIRLCWWCTKLINICWNLRNKPSMCAITYWYQR